MNKILAEHENIDGIWYFSENNNERLKVIQSTTSNLKRSWCQQSKNLDWSSKEEHFLEEFLYQSTQVKNIWIPYGEWYTNNMLINVDPILSPDILKTLREMGHGDRLVISDINYPAHSNHNRVHR